MKRQLVPLATVVVALVAAGAALASNVVKGATYSGKINRASSAVFTISFKVSANGRKVSDFKVATLPVYCQGGGFGTPQSVTAPISKTGAFTAKLPIYFAPRNAHQGFLKLTGKFAKGGKESGKATTDFTTSTSCNGTSSYSTTG